MTARFLKLSCALLLSLACEGSALAVVLGSNQIVTGTATTLDSGPGSGNGSATISFGTNAIPSFTFRYGSGSGTDPNPTYQHIGIHDITFTLVPKITRHSRPSAPA